MIFQHLFFQRKVSFLSPECHVALDRLEYSVVDRPRARGERAAVEQLILLLDSARANFARSQERKLKNF